MYAAIFLVISCSLSSLQIYGSTCTQSTASRPKIYQETFFKYEIIETTSHNNSNVETLAQFGPFEMHGMTDSLGTSGTIHILNRATAERSTPELVSKENDKMEECHCLRTNCGLIPTEEAAGTISLPIALRELKGKVWVDVGSGGSKAVHDARRFGVESYGVDLFMTKSQLKNFPGVLFPGMAEMLPFRSGTVDIITSAYAGFRYRAQNLEKLKELFAESRRVLVNEGKLLLFGTRNTKQIVEWINSGEFEGFLLTDYGFRAPRTSKSPNDLGGYKVEKHSVHVNESIAFIEVTKTNK